MGSLFVHCFCTIPTVLRTSNTSLILVVGVRCTCTPTCLLSFPEPCADLSPERWLERQSMQTLAYIDQMQKQRGLSGFLLHLWLRTPEAIHGPFTSIDAIVSILSIVIPIIPAP